MTYDEMIEDVQRYAKEVEAAMARIREAKASAAGSVGSDGRGSGSLDKPSTSSNSGGGTKPSYQIVTNQDDIKHWYPVEGAYASGTHSVPKSGVYNVDELGEELILPPSKGRYEYLKYGTSVIPADISKNLIKIGLSNPFEMIQNAMSGIGQLIQNMGGNNDGLVLEGCTFHIQSNANDYSGLISDIYRVARVQKPKGR